MLITGGTGGLGALVARHLVAEHGVRHLLLTSRRGPDAPDATTLRDELTAAGATVTLAACDAADRNALTTLLTTVPDTHPLRGIVHAAGIIDDALIASLTPDRLDAVLRPKADAAWHLHELSIEHGLDLTAFVLFSSTTGFLDNGGQANYAAANTFLDALAHHRHAAGLTATSLAWHLWEGDGMGAVLDPAVFERQRRLGTPAITARDGLALFDAALGTGETVLVPLRIDGAALAAAERVPAPLRELVVPGRAPVRAAASAAPTGDVAPVAVEQSLEERLAGRPEDEQLRIVLDVVRHQVAAVRHDDPNAIDMSRGFTELGLDSLAAIELRNLLGAETGLRLPATMMFDYPSPDVLARYLLEELAPPQAEPAAAEASPGAAGATCFCVSMDGGPAADDGFDLALTEVVDEAGHRFLVRVGSEAGADVLSQVPHRPADTQTQTAARGAVDAARDRMGRAMPPVDLRTLMGASLEAERWDDVADRCLTCGNCTMVCPTCFCTTSEEVTSPARC
ncbi:SDR family NAD(P)-dependent oxidoreductase [Streptomyces sp. GLT-R25]